MMSCFEKCKTNLCVLLTALVLAIGHASANEHSSTRPVFSVGDLSATERVEIFYSPTCPDCFLAFRNAVANLIDKEVRQGKVLLTLYLMPRNVDDIKIGAWLSCVPQPKFGLLMLEYMTRRAYGFEYSEAELFSLIKQYGATTESLAQCVTEPKIDQLKTLNSIGRKVGIDDTPGWYIRGKLYQRVYFYWQLQPLLAVR
jgi:protein-disulfide isomerase